MTVMSNDELMGQILPYLLKLSLLFHKSNKTYQNTITNIYLNCTYPKKGKRFFIK